MLYNATNVANYRVNSFWAYNFWNTGGLFKMGFKCDLAGACPLGDGTGATAPATTFLGISTRFWSVAMLGVALVSIIVLLRERPRHRLPGAGNRTVDVRVLPVVDSHA